MLFIFTWNTGLITDIRSTILIPPGNYLEVFRQACFTYKTAMYWPQVGRRTRAMSGELFHGWTVRWSEGSRTAKGFVGRRTDGSFYFFIER